MVRLGKYAIGGIHMAVDTLTDEKKIIMLEDYLRDHQYRDYVIFKIGVTLGLRVSDFLDMPEDAKEKRRKSGLKPYYTVGYFREMCEKGRVNLTQQKTDKRVLFKMPDETKELILDYIKGKRDDQMMFPSRKGGKALTRVGFFQSIKEAAIVCGLTENLGCHSMRKTFGYFHHKKYKNIRLLMSIFNHSREEVTLRYIGVAQEEIDESTKNLTIGNYSTVVTEEGREKAKRMLKESLEQRKKKANADKRKKASNK